MSTKCVVNFEIFTCGYLRSDTLLWLLPSSNVVLFELDFLAAESLVYHPHKSRLACWGISVKPHTIDLFVHPCEKYIVNCFDGIIVTSRANNIQTFKRVQFSILFKPIFKSSGNTTYLLSFSIVLNIRLVNASDLPIYGVQILLLN